MSVAHNRKNLAGRRFGRLVALRQNGKYRRKLCWDCKCDCGNEINAIGCNLTNEGSTSCGCKSVEATIKRNLSTAKHGLAGTRTYAAWYGIIDRCKNETCEDYHNYGGRGIRVCEFIASGPQAFVSIMGIKSENERPRARSVDRIDTNGNYSCGVCDECARNGWPMNMRWATQKQQMRNIRMNRIITIGGRSKCLAEWAEESGLKYGTLAMRLKLGWPSDRLLIPKTR